jgi:hypothetical protein
MAEERRPVSELGHWEGMVFVFNERLTNHLTGPSGVTKIDFSNVQWPEEGPLPLNEVIEAFVYPESDAPPEPAEGVLGGQFSSIRIPRREK